MWDATIFTPVDLRMFRSYLLAPIIDPEHRDSRFLCGLPKYIVSRGFILEVTC